ncbi:MAG: response regulator [Acidimicrobiia bacterium]|nr:response regulator [Acidimicrobiia bacterium]
MRILVVDDHLPTLELMRLTLTSFGHSVSSATGVVEALELADTDPPDVILSDLTFSSITGQEQDGHALARAVRSRPGHESIGLLAITGVVSPSELQAAIDSGFDGVVVKPFDLESLIERIDALGHGLGRGRSDQ